MGILLKAYTNAYIDGAIAVWNEVVGDGIAFPQLDELDRQTGHAFFSAQSHTALAIDEATDEVVGLYILHPNNEGRCGHICNASYAVRSTARGQKVGELLVRNCLEKAKEIGFAILQFNAVVASNLPALSLYQKLGFTQLGRIPKGFLMKDGHFEDIIVHYITL